MKSKLLNIILIITSLFGYLEWGQHNTSFLFEIEYQVIINIFTNIEAVAHPFVLVPLFGQIVLFSTLFLKKPHRYLTYIGVVSLSLLLGFMFFIGIFSYHLKILISTLPFFLTVLIVVKHDRLTTSH